MDYNANNQFITNSSTDDMEALVNGNAQTVGSITNKFNPNNYLNTRLEPNETQRQTRVRLLPISADSTKIFASAQTHSLRVPHQVAKSGFKSYVCLNDPNIPGYDPNVKCPICEKAKQLFNKAREYNPKDIAEKASQLEMQAIQYANAGDMNTANAIRQQISEMQSKQDPQLSKAIFKEACSLKSKKTYYVRVIERGKENEGVKFWRFNENSEHDGIYDHLVKLYMQRRDDMKEAGIDQAYNIFDLNNGRDFYVTLTQKEDDVKPGQTGNRPKRTKITVSDVSVNTPLTKDVELGNQWLRDEKKWSDCYSIKGKEYLEIVIEGKIPKLDRSTGKYVAVEPDMTGAQNTINMVEATTQAITIGNGNVVDSKYAAKTVPNNYYQPDSTAVNNTDIPF